MLRFCASIIAFVLMSNPASAAPGDLLFKLAAPDPQNGSGFGEALSVFDGKILVSEPNRRIGELIFVGRPYLFDATTGQLQHIFNDPEPVNRSTFGESLAGGDGSVFIGSAFRQRVYAFDYTTGQLQSRIDSPNGGGEGFGRDVAYRAGGLLVSALHSASRATRAFQSARPISTTLPRDN